MGIIFSIKRILFGARSNKPATAAKTIGNLQREPLAAWADSDIILGLRFCATLQLRTPLRVLRRHGKLHRDKNKAPPEYAHEMWEGIWIPQVLKGPPGGEMSSDVGPIPATGGDYLPFLIALHRIVEEKEPIELRIEKLRNMPVNDVWQGYLEKHGGVETIINRFFPRIFDLGAGLDTPNQVAAASDEELLEIKGVGPAKLRALRERCAQITENRDSERLESVAR